MNIFEKNRVIFEILEHYISKMDKPEDILPACTTAGQYAMHRNTGYYSSKVIEEAYQRIAIEQDFGNDYVKGTLLMVLTENPEGGYINCVRNIHKALESHYKIETFNVNFNPKLSVIERAVYLKKVASQYEKILIFPNFLDSIYILAFAKNFHRPVMSVNICNTIFNIGDSIADLWLDGSDFDIQRSIYQRGIDRNRVKLLPLKAPEIKVKLSNKEDIRKLLHLSEGHSLIFSCGGWHKYMPIDESRSYFKLCKDLLESRNDLHIITAGFPPKHCPFYKETLSVHPRFHSSDYLSRQDYWDLMNLCDIYLDSYPQNGCTTVVEAGLLRKPIVTLWGSGMTPPAFHNTSSIHIEDVIHKVHEYLNGERQIDYIKRFEYFHGSGWETLVLDAINSCPTEHKLWEVKPNPNNPEVDLDVALSRENNTEWSLYFNDTSLIDKPEFEILKIIQRFSQEVNKGLTYKRYI